MWSKWWVKKNWANKLQKCQKPLQDHMTAKCVNKNVIRTSGPQASSPCSSSQGVRDIRTREVSKREKTRRSTPFCYSNSQQGKTQLVLCFQLDSGCSTSNKTKSSDKAGNREKAMGIVQEKQANAKEGKKPIKARQRKKKKGNLRSALLKPTLGPRKELKKGQIIISLLCYKCERVNELQKCASNIFLLPKWAIRKGRSRWSRLQHQWEERGGAGEAEKK